MNVFDLAPFIGNVSVIGATRLRSGFKVDGSDTTPLVGAMPVDARHVARYLFSDTPFKVYGITTGDIGIDSRQV